MWEFTIKQDGLKITSDFEEDKESALNKCFDYVSICAEEDFKKMTIELKQMEG